jgi:hypothetical protein
MSEWNESKTVTHSDKDMQILSAIAQTVADQKNLEAKRLDLLAHARMRGIPWSYLTESLGISHRQQAHAKYGKKIKARIDELLEQIE